MNYSLLKDLLTGASIGLSPAVAWLTYFSTWNARLRERRASIRRRLIELKEEIDQVGNWARTPYAQDADREEWKNPFWRVLDLPSIRLIAFNAEFEPSDIGRALSDALAQLEVSVLEFKDLLRQHRQYVDDGIKEYHLPDPKDPGKTYFLPPAGWVLELHRLNKEIHIRGIGDANSPAGLHPAWKKASVALETSIGSLKERKKPKILWVGHILATLLGLVGLFFLGSLLLQLVRQMICVV